jgi:hypothetical protein
MSDCSQILQFEVVWKFHGTITRSTSGNLGTRKYVPAHSAQLVWQFVNKLMQNTTACYLPNIASCNIFLLLKLKKIFKGTRFEDVEVTHIMQQRL